VRKFHNLLLPVLLVAGQILMPAPVTAKDMQATVEWRCEVGYRDIAGHCQKIDVPDIAVAIGLL